MTAPVSPRTVQLYFRQLHALLGWIAEEVPLESLPTDNLRPPVVRQDQVQPFTQEQVQALLAAARRTHHYRRDEAIVYFLVDTGARATELCSVKVKDLDLTGRRCTVQGKGRKQRSLYFGRNTGKALWNYLKEEPREDDRPLFLADRGHTPGEPLTRSGLFQLIRRLGRAASLEAVRCSPHTFRHTFAIEFLRNGGSEFTLMKILGHTRLTRTQRYVALAQADIQAKHRQFSPVDRRKKR